MGLGLSLHLESKPHGLLRRRKSAREVTYDMAATLRAGIVHGLPDLKDLVRVDSDERETWLTIHPFGQNIFLVPEGEHGVHVDVRTATPGPGYHAFVLEQLEQAGAALDLELSPGTEDDPLDETGYITSRDFAALQAEFARWLRRVCEVAVENSPGSMALSMDPNTPTPVEYEILTSMGEFTFDWARRIAVRAPDAIAPEAPEFFAWWEQGVGPRTLEGLARVLVHDFAWHPPEQEGERVHAQLLFELLGKVDPAVRFGSDTVAKLRREIDALLHASPDDPVPPRADGFGFRRRLVHRRVFGRGSVVVPGYWYTSDDPENGLEIVYFGPRQLDLCWLAFAADRENANLHEALDVVFDKLVDSEGRQFEFEFPEGRGRAWIASAPSDTERPWTAKGVVAASREILTAVFEYVDPADEAFVERTLRSLRLTPNAG